MSATTIDEKGLKKIYLIKVEPGANNNKFYNLFEIGNGNFRAEYGRVGGHTNVEIYPMSKWDSKYKEKLSARKGYEDKTHLFLEEIKKDEGKSTIKEITNKVVANLVSQLRKYAKISVESNYIVSDQKVTQKMVDEAQGLVDEITGLIKRGQNVEPINKLLVDLFKVIPRKMRHVKDYLFQGTIIDTKAELKEAQKLISQEQATLDVMAGQVSTNSKLDIKNASPSTMNVLESMGLIIEEVSKTEIDLIKKMMGDQKHKFRAGFMIINNKTQEKFDKNLNKASNKKLELFWHGSRNENWWSILDKGWMIRPTNAILTGSYYGRGIYWANRFKKSLGYTSLNGSYWAGGNDDKAFLSIACVHVGNQLHSKRHEDWHYNLDYNALQKKGNYDSVFAHGGADLINDEFIVYTEPQCTVKYLIEVSD